MSTDYRISVIIPCYNAERTITDTLNSLLLEFHKAKKSDPNFDFEIIIVNDGSTDGTKKKITDLYSTYIRYFEKENSGVGSSRNFGLRQAKFEYVWFFDSDDLLFENSVANLLKYLIELPDILRFTSVTQDKHTEEIIDTFNNSNSFKLLFAGEYQDYLKNNFIGFACWQLLIKKSILIDNLIEFHPELNICEDVLWNLDLAKKCGDINFTFINLNVVKYVVRSDSVVNTTNSIRNKKNLEDSILFSSLLSKDHYRETYLNNSLDKYRLNSVNQVITRFLSCKMNINEVRINSSRINKLISEKNVDSRVIQTYKLLSKSNSLIKIGQLLYRTIFLKYVKPRLARN